MEIQDLPEIVVTDHETCGTVLASGQAYDDEEDVFINGPFPHVLSIVGTWEDEGDPPGGWAVWENYEARKLRLAFDDVVMTSSHGEGATPEQVQEILDFADGVDGRCIIHCAAGLSRSTAAALGVIIQLLGPGKEREAVGYLMRIKKSLRPNRGMTRMIDEILGLEGRLVAAHVEAWGPSPVFG